MPAWLVKSVVFEARDPARLASTIGDDRWVALQSVARHMGSALRGRRVVNITDAHPAGALRDVMRTTLGYTRGAGVTVVGHALSTTPEDATITRRIGDRLHGLRDDDGPLGDAERRRLTEMARVNLADIDHVVPGDIYVLHDPGTAALIPLIRAAGGIVIWRCYLGSDRHTDGTTQAWHFLQPFVSAAHQIVVNRRTSLPTFLAGPRVSIIALGIDPCTTRNQPLSAEEARATLTRVGILAGDRDRVDTYPSEDGRRPHLPRHDVMDDPPLPADARLVVQIGEWTERSDMAGVLEGFAHHTPTTEDVHLILCGSSRPEDEDREARAVLADCIARRDALPDEKRARVHIMGLPHHDDDVAAHIVNALQVAADVVVQKSRTEEFGVTVTEAMWKGRPVVASAVGGISDLIADERDGLLLGNPDDLPGFGRLLARMLSDHALAAELGAAARTRVHRAFLPDRQLLQYATLVSRPPIDEPAAGTIASRA